MEAVQEDRDVDVDDVSAEEGSVVRDTVADDVVHGGADRLGEVSVVERGGIGSGLESQSGDELVDLLRGDPGGGETAGLPQYLAGQAGGRPQSRNVLGGVDCGLGGTRGRHTAQVISWQ